LRIKFKQILSTAELYSFEVVHDYSPPEVMGARVAIILGDTRRREWALLVRCS